MKSTKVLWRIVGSIAFISTLLFVFGFVYATQDIINPKPSGLNEDQTPTNTITELFPQGELTLLALGDSLTKGTGDLSGDGGYVGKTKKKLAELTKKPVNVVNEAVSGWRVDDLLNSLKRPNMQNLVRNADIVLLTIGGNNLNHASDNPIEVTNSKAQATPAPAETKAPLVQSEINYREINKNLSAFEGKLDQILTKIAMLNPKAKIAYVGLYNPYYLQDSTKEGTVILQEWNLKANQIANRFPNMIVVPSFDLFQLEIKKYLYIDEFHPNSLGYERIANRVVQALQ
ncbi:MAG: GDSL-type esterase/lipase family protein [Paenibacillaceae bacterium]